VGRRMKTVQKCVHVYVNGQMIIVEAIPGMEVKEHGKMMDGVNPIMMYLIYCKNFCKCYHEPPPRTMKR
jgi:hypothetical protein